MLLSSIVAILLAQTAAPFAVSAGWQSAPLAEHEYASYTRAVTGAPDETLTAIARVCDCNPDRVVSEIADEIGKLPNVKIRRSTTGMCGHSAQHLIVTGLTNVTAKNVDLYAFRTATQLVLISFDFTKPGASPDDESDLRALCVPPAPATPSALPAA